MKIYIYTFLSYYDLFGPMVIIVHKFMTDMNTNEIFRDILLLKIRYLAPMMV